MIDFAILSEPYPLSEAQINQYQRDGYIKLKNVLPGEVLEAYGELFSELVIQYSQQKLALEERGTYGKAFLQVPNLWEFDERVHPFCLSSRLGRIAAELMCVEGVRMYHDQALFKEPGGGFTPWHVDQFYWPLSNDNSITAWIPMQETPYEMGPLQFCIGSHHIMTGRDLAISDESEEKINTNLKDYRKDETAYELGEISFHSGWTFHRAGPNNTDQMRKVMTIIYMEDGIKVAPYAHSNHEADHARWIPGIPVGEVAASHLNPVIWRYRR